MNAPLQDCAALLRRAPGDYAWEAAPEPIPREAYTEAEGILIERSREIPGVAGFYRFGPVRYPGLSDLDVLVVLEDGFRDFARLAPLLRENLPPATWRVVLHQPYFIRRAELAKVFEFAPFFMFEAAWAAPGLPTAAANDNPLDLWLFLLDIVAESYPREFIQFLLAPRLDTRMLIGRIKGLAYCFELLARLTGRREAGFDDYAVRVDRLRRDFFTLGEGERNALTLTLTQEAVGISHALARRAAEAAAGQWGLRVRGELGLYCAYDPALYSDRAAGGPRYGTVRLRHTEVLTLAPALAGWLVREYSRGTGPFSARLQGRLIDRLRVEAPPPLEVTEAIRRRAALRNAHTAWIDSSGLGLSGFLTFGYRMRRRPGGLGSLKEAAGRAADRAREALLRRRLAAAMKK